MKKLLVVALSSVLVISLGVYVYLSLFGQNIETILRKIVTQDPDAVVTVAVWEDGKENFYCYTKDGIEEYKPHLYQIGSLTKTFTGAMLAYLDANAAVPKEERHLIDLLETHKSGLSDEWEKALASDESKIFTREELLKMAENLDLQEHSFEYSNIGSAIAGTIAADIYAESYKLQDTSYREAMNSFIKKELELEHTRVGTPGDFVHNWVWNENDEMMAAGAITSNADDLIKYGKEYLATGSEYGYLKQEIENKGSIDDDYDIGTFWIIDRKNGIIWHNGELAMEDENGNDVGHMSFLGISPEKNKVVVVLSNSICAKKDGTAYTDILGYLLMDEDMDSITAVKK